MFVPVSCSLPSHSPPLSPLLHMARHNTLAYEQLPFLTINLIRCGGIVRLATLKPHNRCPKQGRIAQEQRSFTKSPSTLRKRSKYNKCEGNMVHLYLYSDNGVYFFYLKRNTFILTVCCVVKDDKRKNVLGVSRTFFLEHLIAVSLLFIHFKFFFVYSYKTLQFYERLLSTTAILVYSFNYFIYIYLFLIHRL